MSINMPQTYITNNNSTIFIQFNPPPNPRKRTRAKTISKPQNINKPIQPRVPTRHASLQKIEKLVNFVLERTSNPREDWSFYRDEAERNGIKGFTLRTAKSVLFDAIACPHRGEETRQKASTIFSKIWPSIQPGKPSILYCNYCKDDKGAESFNRLKTQLTWEFEFEKLIPARTISNQESLNDHDKINEDVKILLDFAENSLSHLL